jgi:hypothetical protein
MMTGTELTREQEARLVNTLEQDPDLWLVLLTLYITSEAKESEELKLGLLENTDKWQSLARDVKHWGFGDLADLARHRTSQWNAWFWYLLGDVGHVNLLSFYLRSLISLKTKRVTDIGPRAEVRQRINGGLTTVANDALASLERFRHAADMLGSGKPITAQARAYYEAAQMENVLQIAALLGVRVQLGEAKQTDDIRQLQHFIRRSLVEPLEARAATLTGADKKQAPDKAASFHRLVQAVEINFE